jgi:hypothetical protein
MRHNEEVNKMRIVYICARTGDNVVKENGDTFIIWGDDSHRHKFYVPGNRSRTLADIIDMMNRVHEYEEKIR